MIRRGRAVLGAIAGLVLVSSALVAVHLHFPPAALHVEARDLAPVSRNVERAPTTADDDGGTLGLARASFADWLLRAEREAALSHAGARPPQDDDSADAWRAYLLVPEEGRAHARTRLESFERYARLHAAILAAPAGTDSVFFDGQSIARRFIHVRPCCQLGNRLRVLLSALALGVLTDRAVFIDFAGADYYGSLEDLFAPTVDLSPASARAAGGGVDARALTWTHVLHGFVCDDVLRDPARTLTIEGSPAFVHALHLNPHLRDRFRAALGAPEGVHGALFRYFLPLAPQVEAMLRTARADLPLLPAAPLRAFDARGGRPLRVGVHIRNGGDFRTRKLSAADWAGLAACALAVVPEAQRQAAAFYLAADGAETRALARDAFRAALGSATRIVSLRGLAKRRGCARTSTDCTESVAGARHSMVELALLAACDLRVLSPMSSFSELAGALSGRRAAYFHPDLSRKFHYEAAVEVAPSCFVPHTAEMPGSISLSQTLDRSTCADAVRNVTPSAWTHPKGLRFLNGSYGVPRVLARRFANID